MIIVTLLSYAIMYNSEICRIWSSCRSILTCSYPGDLRICSQRWDIGVGIVMKIKHIALLVSILYWMNTFEIMYNSEICRNWSSCRSRLTCSYPGDLRICSQRWAIIAEFYEDYGLDPSDPYHTTWTISLLGNVEKLGMIMATKEIKSVSKTVNLAWHSLALP